MKKTPKNGKNDWISWIFGILRQIFLREGYANNFISFSLLSAFHYFLFHKDIVNFFEIIGLLLKADIILGNFSVKFCLV